jgi:hypothetical protein
MGISTSDLCTWKLGKYIDRKEICCEVFASIHLAQEGVQNSAFSKQCNELSDFTEYEEFIYQPPHHKSLNA